jgi:hypothetical protein
MTLNAELVNIRKEALAAYLKLLTFARRSEENHETSRLNPIPPEQIL